MKFGLMFANTGPFGVPESLARLARAAEEHGIESMWTVEHVVIPVGYQSPYPYSPSGKIPGAENVSIPDPLLPLAFVAAVTKTIRLGTAILILPQRHPAYVAKEVATLDVLSKGRAILGIGSGWLAEEFEVVGVPFRERGARTDESIRAIRSLWQASPASFSGKFYRWPVVESNPKPAQSGGVPIVIGGHSEAAARRAARLGNGFFPARGDRDTLTRLFAALRAECAKVGPQARRDRAHHGRRRQDRRRRREALPGDGCTTADDLPGRFRRGIRTPRPRRFRRARDRQTFVAR